MSTSTRVLELLSLLQNHRFWPGDELARRLEVSPRTLRRDVEQLRDLGYPVQAHRGVGGGYQLAPGGSLPPLVMEDTEAVAVVLGLRRIADRGADNIADAAVRALTKVVAVLPARLRRAADDLHAAMPRSEQTASTRRDADIGVLTALAAACRDHEAVAFAYRKRHGEQSGRRVEPHALVPHGALWYLVAFDTGVGDWRTFRVDRVADVAPTRRRFRPRAVPGGDAAAFVTAGIVTASARHRVDVTIAAPADRVRAEAGQWGEVTEDADGTSRLVLHAESLDWAAFVLGSLGASFTIHEPPELADRLDAWAELFRKAVDADRTVDGTRD